MAVLAAAVFALAGCEDGTDKETEKEIKKVGDLVAPANLVAIAESARSIYLEDVVKSMMDRMTKRAKRNSMKECKST